MDLLHLKEEIICLKRDRQAVVLAHNYQRNEVQEIADYTGDSFALSRIAASTDAEVIVFCGVYFMAESAFILSPGKTILLPDSGAGCPLADTITAEALLSKRAQYPNAAVVAYINSPAEVKAVSDICCTSSNAVQVVNSLDQEEVIFVPDRNLAAFVSGSTDKVIIPWDGSCVTHDHMTKEDVFRQRELHPNAPISVHPECRPEVVAMADHVGSTSAIIEYAATVPAKKIIIGTEAGTFYKLKKDNPGKEFILLSPDLVCPNMKLVTLEKIKISLETMVPQVTVPDKSREDAHRSLERMLAVRQES
ncbi:MAG: quinolinate synthase NadA [Bacillota bacterium]